MTISADDPYRQSAGAGEAGMGYVCVMKNGFWSSFHNQALLADKSSLSFGINYQNRFSLKELGTRSLGVRLPAGKASLGAIYSYFGYSDFSRQMTGLACGMKLSEKLSAGIQIDYFIERATGEQNNKQSVTCETGLLLYLSDNTRIGIQLFNPIPNSLRKSYLPASLRVGAGTSLNEVLFAGLEAEMSSGNVVILKTGFEYEAVKKLVIRGGFITQNNSFCFGMGFNLKAGQIDLGFATHEMLGITSSVSLVYKIH